MHKSSSHFSFLLVLYIVILVLQNTTLTPFMVFYRVNHFAKKKKKWAFIFEVFYIIIVTVRARGLLYTAFSSAYFELTTFKISFGFLECMSEIFLWPPDIYLSKCFRFGILHPHKVIKLVIWMLCMNNLYVIILHLDIKNRSCHSDRTVCNVALKSDEMAADVIYFVFS